MAAGLGVADGALAMFVGVGRGVEWRAVVVEVLHAAKALSITAIKRIKRECRRTAGSGIVFPTV
jgi:hypothetical protein